MDKTALKKAGVILFTVAAGIFVYKTIANRVPAVAKAGAVVTQGV